MGNTNTNELGKNVLGMRLHEFMLSENLTKEEVAIQTNTGLSTVYNVLNGNNFSAQFLDKLSQAFPQLNMNWFLAGRGTMLHEQHQGPGKPNWQQEYQALCMEVVQFPPPPEKLQDKQAKERTLAYYNMLDRGLDMYLGLLSEIADIHTNILISLKEEGVLDE